MTARTCPRCGCETFEKAPAAGGGERHRCLRCAWPDAVLSPGGRRLAKTLRLVAGVPAGTLILTASDSNRRHAELICAEAGRHDIRVVGPPIRRAGRTCDWVSLDEYAALATYKLP